MGARSAENLVKKSLPLFLLFLFCSGLLLVAMLTIFFRMQVGSYERGLVEKERHSLNLQRKMTRNHFAMIVSDLLFLAEEEELKAYLEKTSVENLQFVNSEYLTFSAHKKNYEQIRYIDNSGKEVVRVNYHGGQPVIVAKAQLQSKGNRYYFRDTLLLDKGKVFVSPFDLNVEHGKVEIPYKPMIRFGTPVFDQMGTKRGIVLINYLGQDLLKLFLEIGLKEQNQAMLVNKEGYWLLHPDSDKEWGFMFSDQQQLNFAEQYPDVWQQIRSSYSGELNTPEGLYIYTTIAPLESDYISSTGAAPGSHPRDRKVTADEYFWKMISFISTDSLSAYLNNLKINLFGLGGVLFLVGAPGLWLLAETLTRRKLYQSQLITMAHYDALTGLPNRTLLFDRAGQALVLAKRYDRLCALLYVDLDGFKLVNDTLGHAAGDELLIAVGQKMVDCCRSSDTIARLGGDEFIILLTEITGTEGAEVLAKQLLLAFNEDFSLKKGNANIGASIGIATFPAHGNSVDQLLKSADQAMYLSKKRGKNTFTVADSIQF